MPFFCRKQTDKNGIKMCTFCASSITYRQTWRSFVCHLAVCPSVQPCTHQPIMLSTPLTTPPSFVPLTSIPIYHSVFSTLVNVFHHFVIFKLFRFFCLFFSWRKYVQTFSEHLIHTCSSQWVQYLLLP